MKPFLWTVLLGASLAAPAAAQPAPASPLGGISSKEATTLPADVLAEKALRAVAARMTSVTRPYVRRGAGDEPLSELVFASAPRSSGDFGLCAATTVHVGTDRILRSNISTEGLIAAELVYKVIGDVEDRGNWTDEYAARQAADCAKAGPVILADARDEGQPVFFRSTGAPRPVVSVIALQRAIRGARDGTYRDVGCDAEVPEAERAPECRDAKALLAKLDLARLTDVELSHAGKSETYQVSAIFRLSTQEIWQVTLDVDVSMSVAAGTEYRLGHATIVRETVLDVDEDFLDGASSDTGKP